MGLQARALGDAMDDQLNPISLPPRAERDHIKVLARQVWRSWLADAIASGVIASAIAVAAWSLM